VAPDEIGFADNDEVQLRVDAIRRLLDHVLDADDGEYWLSNVSTLLDVWNNTGKDVRLLPPRIQRAYGVTPTSDDLAKPIWQLVDRLEANKAQPKKRPWRRRR
jgi:hypothetical protein